MMRTLTIARREIISFFFSPVAYMVLIIFTFVTTLLFFATFGAGAPANLRTELGWIVWLLVFVTPAISMRLLSEEVNHGTIELLMTVPISDTELILGKWLGATATFASLLVPVLVHVVVLELYANPDYGPIITGLAGMLLVGGLYLAIGTFVSATSQSQLVAFMLTLLVTGFLTIGMYMLGRADWAPPGLQQAMFYLNVDQQFADFAKGLIDVTNLVYFASGIALFLFLAVLTLQSRRWR